MPIRVKCEQCKKTLSVKDHLAGKKIKCPVCQSVLTVGAALPTAPAEGSPPPAKPATPKAPAPAAAKKPAVMGKPVAIAKPAADKSKTNGTAPLADTAKNNGAPAPPPKPKEVDLPPENVEAEALAAFADEPPPKVEDTTPQTIDFKCEYCDEIVHLPLELGGKQTQCPNPECRRIIKVPLPKIEGKKDWRKMDRKGPAAALVSQPEQLEDAWGTQDATRARQASLAQAGAIAAPPKPRRDAAGWLMLVGKYAFFCAVIGFVGVFIFRLSSAKKHHRDITEAEKLVLNHDPLVKGLLAAEVKRTIALLYLREIKGAKDSRENSEGARSLANVEVPEGDPAINEQFFRIELALAQIEQAGDEDDVRSKKRLSWEIVIGDLAKTLGDITVPQVQAMAMRAVASRLLEKKQAPAGNIGETVKSQDIALSVLRDEQESLKEFADGQDPAEAKQLDDVSLRVGFAEGYARKGNYEKAFKLTQIDGPASDRLEACLGVAAIALADHKNDDAAKTVKEALKIIAGKDGQGMPDWNLLELIKLAACTEDSDTVIKVVEQLKGPAFKTRALLEIFLAKCEKTTGKVDASELGDLEADFDANKNNKDHKDKGVTLALAWNALARHNARMGASLNENRTALKNRISVLELPPEIVEQIRPMVDVGTYLGASQKN